MTVSQSWLSLHFRYYVLLATAASSAFMFSSRCVINFAILAMVTVESNSTLIIPEAEIGLLPSKAPTLDWDQEQQGIVIGSYHYVYTLLQISTGILADKFDAVKLTILSHFFASLATLAFPLAATTSYGLAITLRVLQGLCHAPIFPCCLVVFENWFTPQEKALAIGAMTFAYNLGTAIVMPVTAWLCINGFAGGWPSAFYCMGIANLIYIALLYLTVSSNPNDSRLISETEKTLISSYLQTKPKSKNPTPWKAMFTSVPLWSATIARGILSTAYNVVNSRIPLYLEIILGYPLQKNGFINSAFYLIDACSQLISGPLSRYIASKGYLSLGATHKLFESISLLGPACFLLSIPFLSGRADVIIFGLIMTMFSMGFATGGDIQMVPEIAPAFVGTVFGFSNTLSCAAGFISPMTIGYILEDQVFSVDRWNMVFFLFGGLQIIGAAQFILFASSNPQPWGVIEETPSKNGDIEMSDKKADKSRDKSVNPRSIN
ncbi:sialin-like [Tetranychus urticae]|uniref:Major facilitator superfamily (MFS) profile domain-containing protein n=1 Tax=Tetranychus urticae TaxID=32264 RepID=T1K5B9_TETUR|nr:sialin-like [Tetranychus urticae]